MKYCATIILPLNHWVISDCASTVADVKQKCQCFPRKKLKILNKSFSTPRLDTHLLFYHWEQAFVLSEDRKLIWFYHWEQTFVLSEDRKLIWFYHWEQTFVLSENRKLIWFYHWEQTFVLSEDRKLIWFYHWEQTFVLSENRKLIWFYHWEQTFVLSEDVMYKAWSDSLGSLFPSIQLLSLTHHLLTTATNTAWGTIHSSFEFNPSSTDDSHQYSMGNNPFNFWV